MERTYLTLTLLPQTEPLKHEPIEDTEYFRTIMDIVRIEAESVVEPDIRLGRSLIVDMEITRILKGNRQLTPACHHEKQRTASCSPQNLLCRE